MSGGRFYIYTLNNPEQSYEQHNESMRSLGSAFHLFQREKAESGTEHFQGYVEFARNVGFVQLKSAFPTAHWERRRGTQAQAIAYNSKEDTRIEGPWTFGEPKKLNNTGCSPGFLPAVKEGKRLHVMHEEFPDDMRKYPRYYESLRQLYPTVGRAEGDAPTIQLIIGAPGSGKTRLVREKYSREDLFVKSVDKDFWMDGYDGHPYVLIDDFQGRQNHVSLVNLLQLLDRYLQYVPKKGGHVWWNPEVIYITTNIHPANWYDYKSRIVHYAALQRRFTHVYNTDDDTMLTPVNDVGSSVAWHKFWKYETNVDQGPPYETGAIGYHATEGWVQEEHQITAKELEKKLQWKKGVTHWCPSDFAEVMDQEKNSNVSDDAPC